MAQGRDLRRAIDRLVADLARIAERVITSEVERAIVEATSRTEPRSSRSPAKAAEPKGPTRSERAAQRRAEREAERAERQAARERRRQEREQLKQELLSAREAARQARESTRDQHRKDKVAAREAAQRAREAERAAQLAPPPLVVFKRSRDGQVTVLQPRSVEPEPAATPSA